ncbi:DUF6161 domain-containing protein [Ketobacter alkanivorans]|uniref:DUF6161 domain-containing protein n=1 Tax=Ketobacter alkanivorans TaxID=1917421 RepID=A0A2K9LJ72_9GAMM|nr:DUF6161 domain-containing protein [Ketobacter alkanivorans]AUM12287.1 hypothetical protein Kalk_07615 [Ketobacter alkanivorans]
MNVNVNFDFSDLSGKNFKFQDSRALAEFLEFEVNFWAEKNKYIGNQRQLHPSINYCSNFKDVLQKMQSWDEQEDITTEIYQDKLNGLKQNLFRHTNTQWLWSGHSYTNIFIDCHKNHGLATAAAFLEYVTKNQVGNLNSPESFLGVMIGYDYLNQGADLVKRGKAERESIELLRCELESAHKALFGEIEAFKKTFNEWDATVKENWNTWLVDSNEQNSNLQKSTKDEFVSFMDGCNTRIQDLENTYQEKLRLEKPATYWNIAARKYGVQGGLWALALIAAVLLGLVYFSNFFLGWLEGKPIPLGLHTIQGVVIFGSIATAYAFLVRVLSKLTFSSLHLMRDAEEREQLTYLYLSLMKDSDVSEADRRIVLQALFSRSETGLLAAEHGPTMPSVGEIVSTASKLK